MFAYISHVNGKNEDKLKNQLNQSQIQARCVLYQDLLRRGETQAAGKKT